MRKNLILLLPFFVIIGMTGCDKKEEDPTIYDLYFQHKEFHGQLGNKFSISINGGNKDYTITPTNPDMLTYKLDMEAADLGTIDITPLKKGTTTLLVKDNVTSQEETLTINITDKYIYLHISYVNPEQPQVKLTSDDPNIKERIIEKMKDELTDELYTLVLINNERKTFYRVDKESESEYKESGYYSLEKEEDRYFLMLYIPAESGVDTKEIYEFSTSGNYPGHILIANYFEIDWSTRSNLGIRYTYLKRDMTEKLKEEFPQLEFARWAMEAWFTMGNKIPLEWFD